MASAVEQALESLAGTVQGGLVLGGVNTHSTLPVGRYGQRLLRKIWAEVEATTDAPFAQEVPSGLVFNSLRACLFLRAYGNAKQCQPFELLHRMQRRLFVEGAITNEEPELLRLAEEFDWPIDSLAAVLGEPALNAQVRFEMESARAYGTAALPSLLLEVGGERRLLAGGYADAQMICGLVRNALALPPAN